MKPRCVPSALPNPSKAVRHFTPSWFTIVMGTGIVGALIGALPLLPVRWKRLGGGSAAKLAEHGSPQSHRARLHCIRNSIAPAAQFPYDTPAKNEVGWAFWWLSIVQFSAFIAMLTSRFIFFPRDALKLFDEPAQVNCCGDLDQHLCIDAQVMGGQVWRMVSSRFSWCSPCQPCLGLM